MGWENKFHCEWNEFGKRVLNYYWPKAESYGDITKTDFSIWRGRIDILTGGFPCQPYSMAGKRKGKEDERHLCPEMLRAIREIQPRYIVGENVYGLLNWNGGLVFDEVQTDLEAEGYEVQPVILPSCGVGAPHRRERIWFVDYSNKCPTGPSRTSSGINGQRSGNNDVKEEWREQTEQHIRYGDVYKTNPNSEDIRLQGECIAGKIEREGQNRIKQPFRLSDVPDWAYFPTQSPICNGNDGISNRLDGITFSKWRTESIKAGGNAVVPKIPFQIFKAINEHEQKIR